MLDTNVVISALLSPGGAPSETVRRWEAGDFEVVISPALLDELMRALSYPQVTRYLRMSESQIAAFLKGYGVAATLVEPDQLLEVIQADQGDNKVLECALAGNAGFIITGDRHLLDLEEYQGIVILPPAGFVRLLDRERGR